MAQDVFGLVVRMMADMGREVADTLGDADGRAALMAHSGLPAPPGPPPDASETANVLETLRARAQAGAATEESLQLLFELTEALAVLVVLRPAGRGAGPREPGRLVEPAGHLPRRRRLAALQGGQPHAARADGGAAPGL